jgi:hypothetical protein
MPQGADGSFPKKGFVNQEPGGEAGGVPNISGTTGSWRWGTRRAPTRTDADRAALRNLLGPEAVFGPLAVAGDAAVAIRQAGAEARRAFVRADDAGWRVVALSGESLRLAATFRVLGLLPRRATELEAAVTVVEADPAGAQQSAIDSFAGTLLFKAHLLFSVLAEFRGQQRLWQISHLSG